MENEATKQIIKNIKSDRKSPDELFTKLLIAASRQEHRVRSEAIKRGLARRASRIQPEPQIRQQINS